MNDADDFRDCMANLSGEVKTPFRLIFTASGTLSPPGFTTVTLEDAIEIDPVSEDWNVLTDLHEIVGAPANRPGGRPSKHKTHLNTLIEVRQSKGVALPGRNEEAKALLTALCSTCETLMSKSVSQARLPEIGQTLELTIKGA